MADEAMAPMWWEWVIRDIRRSGKLVRRSNLPSEWWLIWVELPWIDMVGKVVSWQAGVMKSRSDRVKLEGAGKRSPPPSMRPNSRTGKLEFIQSCKISMAYSSSHTYCGYDTSSLIFDGLWNSNRVSAEDLLTSLTSLDDTSTRAIHFLRDTIAVSMVTILILTTMFAGLSIKAIRSIWEITSVSVVSIFDFISISDDNSTIDSEKLRDIMSTSMDNILKSTAMLDYICIVANETLGSFIGYPPVSLTIVDDTSTISFEALQDNIKLRWKALSLP